MSVYVKLGKGYTRNYVTLPFQRNYTSTSSGTQIWKTLFTTLKVNLFFKTLNFYRFWPPAKIYRPDLPSYSDSISSVCNCDRAYYKSCICSS